MQSKIYAYLTLLVGILLVLPLIGITAMGSLTDGIIGWTIAIAIIIIGITGVIKTSSS